MPETIGDRIRRLRDDQGWNQDTLAAKMQLRGHETITFQRISELEKGTRDLSAVEAVSLARIFGISVSELLGVKDFDPTDR